MSMHIYIYMKLYSFMHIYIQKIKYIFAFIIFNLLYRNIIKHINNEYGKKNNKYLYIYSIKVSINLNQNWILNYQKTIKINLFFY